MKIDQVKHIEDCFDGSYVHEVLFDTAITRTFIESLRRTTQLDYYPEFARPFFKAVVEGEFTLKGIEGNRTVRITSFGGGIDGILSYLRPILAAAENTEGSTGCEGQKEGTDAVICHVD
jgi:hypothetical protein